MDQLVHSANSHGAQYYFIPGSVLSQVTIPHPQGTPRLEDERDLYRECTGFKVRSLKKEKKSDLKSITDKLCNSEFTKDLEASVFSSEQNVDSRKEIFYCLKSVADFIWESEQLWGNSWLSKAQQE